MTVKCPVCEREFEDGTSLNPHIGQKHTGFRIEKECKNCGKTLEVTWSGRDRKFCSIECYQRYRRKNPNKYKKGHGKNESKHEVIVCEQCGKKFEALKSRDKKFCSQDCFIKYEKNHPEKYANYGPDNGFFRKYHTEETKEKIRNSDYHKNLSGSNNPMYGVDGEEAPMYGKSPEFPYPFFSNELGYYVRSSYEEEIGIMLEDNDIEYEYEPKRFKIEKSTYLPDFTFNERNIILEIKGFFRDKQKEKYMCFKNKYPELLFIGIGQYCKAFDIHIKWKNKEKIIDILNKLEDKKKLKKVIL